MFKSLELDSCTCNIISCKRLQVNPSTPIAVIWVRLCKSSYARPS